MMKKMIAAVLCAVMTVSLAACAAAPAATAAPAAAPAAAEEVREEAAEAAEQETDGTFAAKAEGDTFTVGFDAEFPPYGYRGEDGEYTGFDLELAAELCERRGWALEKQPIDWDAKDMELTSGNIDCIWNGFTVTGREDEYTWTEPYIDNSQVFVVAEDSGIASEADLAGKSIGVQADSSALAALEEDRADLAETFGELRQFADYNTAFMDLEQGTIDALALDIGVANYQINSRGGGYVILDEQLSTEQYAVGFALGNTVLRDQVQETLDEMAADGTVAAIAENYADFGVPASLIIGQ